MELIWITAVKVLEGHRLHLTFNNGTCKEFDFAQVLAKGQPIFEPLITCLCSEILLWMVGLLLGRTER